MNNVIAWLLEEENPSIRYFTLRDLCRRSPQDKELRQARALIPNSEQLRRVWQKQHASGCWESEGIPYLPKYKASYWQIMVLGYLGLDRGDHRVRKACNYIFAFQHPEGGFTGTSEKQAKQDFANMAKRRRPVLPRDAWIAAQVYEGQMSCLTGNISAALIRLGYLCDRHVRRALNWLVDIQNSDGGWLCPYWSAHVRDTHGCFYGTIGPLEAFSEVPPAQRTMRLKNAIKRGAEFLLMHHLFKADHHGYAVIKKSWLKITFPWFYSYSVLRALDVLTKLGYTDDRRLGDAVNVLLNKRGKDGAWLLESTPAGRMDISFGRKGTKNKWATLTALQVLQRMRRIHWPA